MLNKSLNNTEPEDWSSFREQLEINYAWPALYIFKFIVPHDKASEVKALFPNHAPTERQSEKGKYSSITIRMMMPGSDAIIEVYKRVQHIDGIIAL
jgi:hypothetical protein